MEHPTILVTPENNRLDYVLEVGYRRSCFKCLELGLESLPFRFCLPSTSPVHPRSIPERNAKKGEQGDNTSWERTARAHRSCLAVVSAYPPRVVRYANTPIARSTCDTGLVHEGRRLVRQSIRSAAGIGEAALLEGLSLGWTKTNGASKPKRP